MHKINLQKQIQEQGFDNQPLQRTVGLMRGCQQWQGHDHNPKGGILGIHAGIIQARLLCNELN